MVKRETTRFTVVRATTIFTADKEIDWLRGDQGSDRLFGGEGNDILWGGQGADRLDGGSGVDRASYYATNGYNGSPSGVQIDLAAGAAHGGDAEGDTFLSIEEIVGSGHNDSLAGNGEDNIFWGVYGDDVLEGRAGQDWLDGGHGNDRLIGGADDDRLDGSYGNDHLEGGHGADILDGGEGTDTLSYARSSAGVTVNLSINTASGGDAYLDVICGFENVTGSSLADTLIGANGANVIEGLAGNDIMTGGADADTFVFAVKQGANGVLTAPGYDTITDFVVGVDHLQFSGVNSIWDLNFTQSGADTIITYAQADGSITLTGVDVNNLLQHHVTDLLL